MEYLRSIQQHVEWLQEEIARLEISNADKQRTIGELRLGRTVSSTIDAFGSVEEAGSGSGSGVSGGLSRGPAQSSAEEELATIGEEVCVLDLSAHPKGREVVTPDIVEAMVLPLTLESVTQSGRRKRVKLSGKSFTRQAAKTVANALLGVRNLCAADFSDIIAGRMEEEALEVLGIICGALRHHANQLTVLDLSDNALGEKGVRLLSPIISALPNLTEIRFCNNGLSALAMSLLTKALAPSRASMRKMVFENNMSGDGGALAVASFISTVKSPMDNLQEFTMGSSRVQQEGGLILIDALGAGAPNLKHLNLTDSMLGVPGARLLGSHFREGKLSQITHLILRDAGLEPEGVLLVCKALCDPMVLPNLVLLDFTLAEIDHSLLKGDFGQVLSVKKQSLTELILDENVGIESENGIDLLLKALKGASMLTRFSMKESELSGVTGVKLVKWAKTLPSDSILLELDGNYFGEESLAQMNQEIAGSKVKLGSLAENEPDLDPGNSNEEE